MKRKNMQLQNVILYIFLNDPDISINRKAIGLMAQQGGHVQV